MSQNLQDSPVGNLDLDLRCPVDTRVLALMRTLACALAEHVGFDDEQVAQVEMAVDEACANVVRHAYTHLGVSPDLPDDSADEHTRRRCQLHARIQVGEGFLRIIIADSGIGLCNTAPGVESVEDFQQRGGGGGLGTLIIRNFMDEVHYDFPEQSGTILTMTKYLKSTARPADQGGPETIHR